ncbi:thiazolylpeptide-type bacteriocin [Ktedonosporobacter rubrisoli]|uniref:Thiazolylpeptide-type bacteriocin n=1 Tax=Ktedonosporobacter rubrisoli TaxID=2509675 RepID=A0A4P6K3Q5_KTERU|nr:thiazolylpeptide-type bacteriocin [Ktedonosporobacter rubrisoli]QBD82829.1 thiazolylpeptide-type bacteriocin [Ktedonosporobacter rubrisoli]
MSKEQIEHLLTLEAELSELEVETFEIEDIFDPGQVAAQGPVKTSGGSGGGGSGGCCSTVSTSTSSCCSCTSCSH